MKRLLLAFWLGCVIPAAVGQVKTGTVVVVYFTQDKIIMAADSRGLLGEVTPSNSECKIAALNRQVVFGSSQVIGVGSPPVGLRPWKNTDEAHTAYNNTPGETPKSVEAIAYRWANSISYYFQSFYFAAPGAVQQAQKDGLLTQAYFAGLDSDGKLSLYFVKITFDATNPLPINFGVQKIEKCLLNDFCFIGETEVVSEFLGLTSDRAKREAATWKPAKGFAPSDYDLLRTIRLVDLTITYHQGIKDVGGPIDAVQLNGDGSLRWFARKRNCPAD